MEIWYLINGLKKDLSSFVVTVWDNDEFRECVKLD